MLLIEAKDYNDMSRKAANFLVYAGAGKFSYETI